MSTLAKLSDYQKDYLPGYTGHVPSKNERFGSTAGQIKKEIMEDKGQNPLNLEIQKRLSGSIRDAMRLYSDKYTPAVDKNKAIYGNMSRFAKNWVCGPNHEIRNQRVPGYTGHVKGLISENLFAGSYGNCTTCAIGKKHPVGHNVVPKHRFLSQNTSEYTPKNFRRFSK